MSYQKTRPSYWYHLSTKTYELSKMCTFMYLLFSHSVHCSSYGLIMALESAPKNFIEKLFYYRKKLCAPFQMHCIQTIQNLVSKVLKFLIFGISLNINLATSCLILIMVIIQMLLTLYLLNQ